MEQGTKTHQTINKSPRPLKCAGVSDCPNPTSVNRNTRCSSQQRSPRLLALKPQRAVCFAVCPHVKRQDHDVPRHLPPVASYAAVNNKSMNPGVSPQQRRTDAVVDHAHQRSGGHVFCPPVPGGDRLPEEIQPSSSAGIKHQTVPGTNVWPDAPQTPVTSHQLTPPLPPPTGRAGQMSREPVQGGVL